MFNSNGFLFLTIYNESYHIIHLLNILSWRRGNVCTRLYTPMLRIVRRDRVPCRLWSPVWSGGRQICTFYPLSVTSKCGTARNQMTSCCDHQVPVNVLLLKRWRVNKKLQLSLLSELLLWKMMENESPPSDQSGISSTVV